MWDASIIINFAWREILEMETLQLYMARRLENRRNNGTKKMGVPYLLLKLFLKNILASVIMRRTITEYSSIPKLHVTQYSIDMLFPGLHIPLYNNRRKHGGFERGWKLIPFRSVYCTQKITVL